MKRLTFEGNFCDIAKCQEILCPYGKDCSQKRVWERLKAIEDVLGKEYDLDHFREVTKKLDAAENCIVPCKPGDTVFRICGPKGHKYIAERIVSAVTLCGDGCWEITSTSFDCLGKTVFLTREEAENALCGGAESCG